MTSLKYSKLLSFKRKAFSLLLELPSYCTDYYTSLSDLSPETSFYYLFELKQLISFLSSYYNEDGFIPQSFPLEKIASITPDILELWISKPSDYHKSSESVSSITSARRRTAFSSFLRFLDSVSVEHSDPVPLVSHNPFNINSKEKLTVQEAEIFLHDIEMNSLFLYKIPGSEPFVSKISVPLKIRREKQVSRNVLIMSLVLFSPLSLDEIASLDLDSIDFINHKISYYDKSDSVKSFIYDSHIADALQKYLYPSEFPDSFIDECTNHEYSDIMDFMRKYMSNPDKLEAASVYFKDDSPEFKRYIDKVAHFYRMQGRRAFFPLPEEKALLLNQKGERLSPRMISHVVLNLSRTYLSDDKDVKVEPVPQ